MATVHLGRLVGAAAFAKTVAIKRPLPHLACDPEFRAMLTDEARLAARVRHANVVQTLDVVSTDDELFLVMEYVDGTSLRRLAKLSANARVPPPIIAAVMAQVLHGLHAAHEATDEAGKPLAIVHRDVSPDNVLVGVDGLARVLDFGVAKATSRLQQTRDGQIKGKLAYMAPEQLAGRATRQSDVFSAAIVFWEGLVGARLFRADDDGETIGKILAGVVERPTAFAPDLDARLDAIVMKGLAQNVRERWATAREMALALERDVPLATPAQIGEWVESLDAASLSERRALVAAAERAGAPAAAATLEATIAAPTALELRGAHDDLATRVDAAVDATTPAPARARRAARIAFGAGAVGLAAIVGVFAVPYVRAAAPPAATPPTAASAPAVEAPVASAPPSTSPGDIPIVPTATPTGTSAAAGRAVPAHHAVHAHRSGNPAAKDPCDPPYHVGPMGEKVWLKACL